MIISDKRIGDVLDMHKYHLQLRYNHTWFSSPLLLHIYILFHNNDTSKKLVGFHIRCSWAVTHGSNALIQRNEDCQQYITIVNVPASTQSFTIQQVNWLL